MANHNQSRITITAGQPLSRTPPGAHVKIRACAFFYIGERSLT